MSWLGNIFSSKTKVRDSALVTQAFNSAMQAGKINAMLDVTKDSADTYKLFKDAKCNWHATGAIRRLARERAQYSMLNNGYIKGMVRTKKVDVVGLGPSLMILSGDEDASMEIKTKYERWFRYVGGPRKQRIIEADRNISGEGLGLVYTDPLSEWPIKLNFRPLSQDQIEDYSDGQDWFQGIKYAADGRELSYRVRERYDVIADGTQADFEDTDANYIIHIYDADQAGQLRGLSELSASLIPAEHLRSFTNSVLKAANIAASITFLLETDEVLADATACTPYDLVNLESGTGMAIPDGYHGKQLKAEQPVDTYASFKNEIVNELGRGMAMPSIKVSGDGSKYNYSSIRADGQEYYAAADVQRDEHEQCVDDKLFRHWWAEAKTTLVGGKPYLSDAARAVDVDELGIPVHRWGWTGRPHVDPNKEAMAETEQLGNGTIGLHELYSKRGKECEAEMEQSARCLGLTVDEYRKRVADNIFQAAAKAQAAQSTNDSKGP